MAASDCEVSAALHPTAAEARLGATGLSMPRATSGGLGAGLGDLGGGRGGQQGMGAAASLGVPAATTRRRPRPFVSAEMPIEPPPRPQPKRGTTLSTPGGAAPPPGAAAAAAAAAAATAAAAAATAALPAAKGGRVSLPLAPRAGAVSPSRREGVAAGAHDPDPSPNPQPQP